MKLIPGEWRYFDQDYEIPFPWYTKPCIEWLTTLDLNQKRVWEYGVGDSTEWYRRRGAKCSGVETDKYWADKCGAMHITDQNAYAASIWKTGMYDIIVIDGINRDNCICFCWESLNPRGYLIIDNWKQPSLNIDWTVTEGIIKKYNLSYVLFTQEDHPEKWTTLVVKK